MKGKRVVVTGGAGFIGTNLVEQLVAEGVQVVVYDSLVAGDASRLPRAVELVVADIADETKLKAACDNADVLVHLAALPRVQFSIDEPVAAHTVNVTGMLTTLEAAQKSGVRRFVFASSSAVYGDQETLPLYEMLPTQPKSPYALHKQVGEEYLLLWSTLFGIETVALRFFNVYGPHLDPEGPYALVIGRFLKQRLAGEALTVTGTGKQTRDFVHVHDVVRSIMAAATVESVGQGEVINIGSGVETSINSLATMIGGPATYIPPRVEPQRTRADITRAKQYLGWEPAIALSEGITDLKKRFGVK